MLASLLPGLRELRAPLAAGYLWLLAAYLVIAPHAPSKDKAHGIIGNFYSLRDAATAVGLGVALSFAAYLVGTLSSGFLNPALRAAPARLRGILRRGGGRPERLGKRSWLAMRDLVVDALRETDAILQGASVRLAALVRDEVPEPDRRAEPTGLVGRVLAAVADELDLVKTRLLGKEAEIFAAVDRHQAEAEFRLAVLPPLAVVAVVVAAISQSILVALVIVAVAVPAVVGLWRQAVAADRSGAEVLVDALRLDRVKSPTLERLAAAARRAAELAPDAPIPALYDRFAVVTTTLEHLDSALQAARSADGAQNDEEVRMVVRAASDELERLEVYISRATGLLERTQTVQQLLQKGSLTSQELDELSDARETIDDIWTIELERPGQVAELSRNLDSLWRALRDADVRQRRVAAHALRETIATSSGDNRKRALSLLAGVLRYTRQSEDERQQGLETRLRQVFESLARNDSSAVVETSWADARLPGVQLANCDLTGIQLMNANLVGADLSNSTLIGARLDYADLASADLVGANLSEAGFESPLVKDLRLKQADLRGATFDPARIPWQLIEGWPEAILDDPVREVATQIGGAAPAGPRILMLSWEAPPLVAGGSWTATYHLVRSLRARGADITVVVPWSEELCLPKPFGTDVEVVFAGIEPSVPTPYVASGGPLPPYLPYSAYSTYWLTAGPDAPYASPYVSAYWFAGSAYGAPYASPYASPYGGPSLAVDAFAQWLGRWPRRSDFAVVHAHDWVTFPAAARAGLPWVAHFHSTADDRRSGVPDWVGGGYERSIEQQAAEHASAVVAPSEITSRHLSEAYGATGTRVVPNPLSRQGPPPAPVGSFEEKRIVFIGRLARQKGPDLFVDLARQARRKFGAVTEDWKFQVYGDGEERSRLERDADGAVTFEGAVPWEERDRAFERASIVVVPSRSEPFGMVIAEAMQRGVPVFYPADAGIGEVVTEGVRFDPSNPDVALNGFSAFLTYEEGWDSLRDRQLQAIESYTAFGHETKVLDLWSELANGYADAASPSSGIARR